MKKNILIGFLFLLSLNTLFAETQYISVKETYLKTSTWFFAKKIATVSYGDKVIITAEKNNWSNVQLTDNPSISGWIANSSLTSKKIVLRNNQNVSTSTDELALAGKGFSQEVEDSYKVTTNWDYSLVDNMEETEVSEAELMDFIIRGELNGVQE